MYSDSSSIYTNCIFENNQFTEQFQAAGGGGMLCYGSFATLIDCTFKNNYSERFGGGMSIMSSSPTLINCTFSNNETGNYGGSAIYIYSSSHPILTDCTFNDNPGKISVIHNNNCNPTLTNCTFSDNGTRALYNWDNGASPTVTNCIFISNGGGAVLNVHECSPILTNCLFINNTSVGNGGAICESRGNSTITNCTFYGNSAGWDGGAIYSGSDFGEPDLVITNCMFWDNGGSDEADQIYVYSGTPVVNYSCIQGLTGSLGGTGNIDTFPSLVNMFDFSDRTIYNGTAGTKTTIYVADASLYTIDDEIEYNNDGVARKVTNVNTTDNIVTFADDALPSIAVSRKNVYNWGYGATDVDEDLHVTDGNSPIVDTGDNEAIDEDYDLDGNTREVDGDGENGAEVDMGPYEYQG